MERCCLKLLLSSTVLVTSLEEIVIVGHHLYCKCITNISRCFSVFGTVTKNAIASFFSILQKNMAQITAPCPNKRKPYSQNRN